MKYSVVLQDPFDYALFWILVGVGLLLAAGILYGLLHLPQIRTKSWKDISFIRSIRLFFRKRKHTKNVKKIEKEFAEKTIDGRTAYQQISREVKQFAQAATGKPVESLVYRELLLMKYPALTDLIGKLYAPEFATRSDADVADMIRESKELIKKWR